MYDFQILFNGKELTVEYERGKITAYEYDDNLETFLKVKLDESDEDKIYETIQEKLKEIDFDKLSGVWYGISTSINYLIDFI